MTSLNIPWITSPDAFPDPARALREPNGLLGFGGEIGPEWLLSAYRMGIFPWFNQADPVLWWSPDPRLVLFPGEIRIRRSLKRVLRQKRFEVCVDTAFAEVIAACAAPRQPDSGTWIVPQMQQAYCKMFELGHAHSIECWHDGQLAGGLYGIALGRVFFGESMFSRQADASKVALVHLAKKLQQLELELIDCQMTTAHLLSMGAREISRNEFCDRIKLRTITNTPPEHWPSDWASSINLDPLEPD